MKTIIVKYHGPTNTKGSRLSVEMEGFPKMWIPYDYSSDKETRSDEAVRSFVDYHSARCNWKSDKMVRGFLPSGDTVYVFLRDYLTVNVG
jgi:hypothetical protein